MVGRGVVGRLLLGVGDSAVVVAARLANIMQQRQQLSTSRSAIRQSRLLTDAMVGWDCMGGGCEQTSTCHMMTKFGELGGKEGCENCFSKNDNIPNYNV